LPENNYQKPLRTFTQNDILKDSDIWDWAIYLQVNRINILSTTIWDDHKMAQNKLLNLISAVEQMEFLCWDKISMTKEGKELYFLEKPEIFKGLYKGNNPNLSSLLTGDPMKQLQLKSSITLWLKCFDHYLGTLKRLRRISYVAGRGELGTGEKESGEI
jgi:hypothetical protein